MDLLCSIHSFNGFSLSTVTDAYMELGGVQLVWGLEKEFSL